MRKLFVTILLLSLTISLCSCGKEPKAPAHVQNLDFTVVEEADLPTQLLELINEKKEKPFRMTYKTESTCYICQGFGTQDTSGYSIIVEDLFLGEDAIYIKNTLIGPAKNEAVYRTPTHPYIVVKVQFTDYDIVFE